MRYAVLLTLAFFMVACTQRSSVPPSILSPIKMRTIMYDALKADDLASFYSEKDSSYKTVAKHDSLYQVIFDLHQTSRAAFIKSLTYYQNHPDLLKNIVDSMEKLSQADQQKKGDTLHSKSKSHY
ncbi:MAG: hypothetical protein NVS1B13_23450 [Flavisolibacter sp.]